MSSPAPVFTEEIQQAAALLIEAAWREDLRGQFDVTSRATVPEDLTGRVKIVARKPGALAGAVIGPLVLQRFQADVRWEALRSDGDSLEPGTAVAVLEGNLRSLLTAERTILNFMIHLSGVATLTREFVRRVSHTSAQILDTRKTLPGYRLLHKYAVRCGGGHNHRMGLFDGMLIKDNHLAAWRTAHPRASLADLIRQAREQFPQLPVEVEVDTLEQLREVLPASPEIVLLDNMGPATLREAVEIRNAAAPGTLLEASGGIDLTTVQAAAESGVDRISVGALTHSAPALDLGFDWQG